MVQTGKREKKPRKKIKALSVVVWVIIAQAFIYTWVHLFLSSRAGMEIAPTTSVAFLGFCLGEVGACALIKNKKNNSKEEPKG